ncbi:MAG: biopolymer transporter ExbD [Desulfuromonas sp.]|nr:MAG: biopolymer transporter ExbD [Desulfuromonas sp.]
MGFRRRRREEPRVDLTSMVDVVFLLLIFFMISTTFVETPGLSIKLPTAGAGAVPKEQREVKIYLSQEGELFLHKEPITFEELATQLDGFGKELAKEMTFLLLADEQARHGKVVELMDAARSAGFGKLAIATENRPQRP